MTKARQDFIDHLKLRGFSQCTIDNYIDNVAQFARFHKASPDLLNHEHVKQYLLHLRDCRKLQIRSINLQFYSLRGYYKDFRKRPEVMENLRRMKEPVFVPVILSREYQDQSDYHLALFIRTAPYRVPLLCSRDIVRHVTNHRGFL